MLNKSSNLLTKEQAAEYLVKHNKLTTVSVFDKFQPEDLPVRSYYFFTDDHCFTLNGGKDLGMDDRYVPSTTQMPCNVMPRGCVPDGRVCTIDDYINVFHVNDTLIETVDTLTEVIKNNVK